VFHCGDGNFVAEDVCYIADKETASFKRIIKDEKAIWQVVIRKLRCWVGASGGKDGDEAIPCRPYCILVNCLYPNSQVQRRRQGCSESIFLTRFLLLLFNRSWGKTYACLLKPFPRPKLC
jgi:hypothetical protein